MNALRKREGQGKPSEEKIASISTRAPPDKRGWGAVGVGKGTKMRRKSTSQILTLMLGMFILKTKILIGLKPTEEGEAYLPGE